MVWIVFVTSMNALFLSNFTLMVHVSYVFNPNNLIMSNPDILSKKGASTFT